MNYISTRDLNKKIYTSAQVIKMGLAPDGGLFVPETIPQINLSDLDFLISQDYPTRAATILSYFLTDYTYKELLNDCKDAYSNCNFSSEIAPTVHIADNIYTLELWHGPTCAFKDMALQLMPRLLSRALYKTGETRNALILVATSGDTGKAALEGYKNIDHVSIQVYYPSDGVSEIQKQQMKSQTGNNVDVCAVSGNFDDAQSGVKKIFSDNLFNEELNKNGVFLSSANSINWGRLAPQIVYYISSYCDLIKDTVIKNGEPVDFVVPTGNFGDILAGFYAKLMGLPIGHLVCASNSNDVLTEFLNCGVYNRKRKFISTISPSMDILISSNLERLLYHICGPQKTCEYMQLLNQNGVYKIDQDSLALIQNTFIGFCATEQQTKDAIYHLFYDNNYLCDTHTSVAFFATKQYLKNKVDNYPIVVISTASPYKFAKDVLNSLHYDSNDNCYQSLTDLSQITKTDIPIPILNIESMPVRFSEVVSPNDMPKHVLAFAMKQ